MLGGGGGGGGEGGGPLIKEGPTLIINDAPHPSNINPGAQKLLTIRGDIY